MKRAGTYLGTPYFAPSSDWGPHVGRTAATSPPHSPHHRHLANFFRTTSHSCAYCHLSIIHSESLGQLNHRINILGSAELSLRHDGRHPEVDGDGGVCPLQALTREPRNQEPEPEQLTTLLQPYLDIRGGLLEGPFYTPARNELRFVDIDKAKVYFVDLAKGPSSLRVVSTGVAVG